MMTETALKHFVVDSMLGKLAKWLRILGFDARCEDLHSREQIDAYGKEGFLLITRTRKWSVQPSVFCLTANDPMEQLRELFMRLPVLPTEIHLLHRCVRCNEKLQKAPREDVAGQAPDYVLAAHASFHRCPSCRRIYWPGTHPQRMMERLHRQLGWVTSNLEIRQDLRDE